MGRFIGYSIGNNEYQVFTNTSSGSSVSTAGSIQYQTSVQIPAGTFSTGEIFSVESMLTKSATNGTVTPYFYIGPNPSLVGATLIATGSVLALATRSFIFYRRFLCVGRSPIELGSGITLFGSNELTPTSSDLGILTGNTLNTIYDDNSGLDSYYIILGANHSSASDSVVGEWIKVSTF
jgi:hypothetical protein